MFIICFFNSWFHLFENHFVPIIDILIFCSLFSFVCPIMDNSMTDCHPSFWPTPDLYPRTSSSPSPSTLYTVIGKHKYHSCDLSPFYTHYHWTYPIPMLFVWSLALSHFISYFASCFIWSIYILSFLLSFTFYPLPHLLLYLPSPLVDPLTFRNSSISYRKGGPEEFFMPDDFEVSRDELYRVCFRAANWRGNGRGLHGKSKSIVQR